MADTSGETNVPVSDWTTGTLKILQDSNIATLKELLESEICAIRKTISESDRRYEQRFDAQEKATMVAIGSAKEAVNKAETANERRFDAVNEFRGQLNDQANTFLPRSEYSARHETLENRVSEITDRLNRSEGQSKGSEITMGRIYAAIAAVGVILGILVLLANNVFN